MEGIRHCRLRLVTWLSPDTKCGKTGIIVGISSPTWIITQARKNRHYTYLLMEDGKLVMPATLLTSLHAATTHREEELGAMRCNSYLTDRDVKGKSVLQLNK